MQILSLVLLCAGGVIITSDSDKSKGLDEGNAELAILTAPAIFRALVAAFLSGLAGTIIQKALQNQSRNPYIVTLELCIFGIGSILISNFISGNSLYDAEGELWTGWSGMTFVTMMASAVGGILIGFVIKYCGNVQKGFAVVFGLLITTFIESFVNDKSFGPVSLLAVICVLSSMHLYSKFPYKKMISILSPDSGSA